MKTNNTLLQKIIYYFFAIFIPCVFLISDKIVYWDAFSISALLIITLFYLFIRYIPYFNILKDLLEVSVVIFMVTTIALFVRLDVIFPFSILIMTAVIFSYFFLVKKYDKKEYYLARGLSNKPVIIYCALIGIVSIIALAAWFKYLGIGIYEDYLPDFPIYILITGGFVFAAMNAFYEELIFRSILFGIFSKQTGIKVALIMQALWFGLFHYSYGFPNGIIGLLMTFCYGILLGILMLVSKGIFLPWIIHFLADSTIFVLVILRKFGHF